MASTTMSGAVPPGTRYAPANAPLWDGVIAPGKSLLIWPEQGLGDVIHCCRFAPLLAARGLRVYLEVPAPLVALARTLPGLAGVVGPGDRLPEVDAHAPIMSLPKFWGMTRVDDAPGPVPYLSADGAAAQAVRQRVRGEAAFVVGIAWRGNPQYAGDRTRSVPAKTFAELCAIPGIRVVNLMKEASAAERAEAKAEDIGAASWTDFAEAAAAFTNLDLVISVDTAAAHLAGALGLPVWIALPVAPDWRWGLEREDSPWYPTARLFRQQIRGDWQEVFGRIAEELRRQIASGGP